MNADWLQRYLVCSWDERGRSMERDRARRDEIDERRQAFGAEVFARAEANRFPRIQFFGRGARDVSLVLGERQAWEALCCLGKVDDVADAMMELDAVEAAAWHAPERLASPA